MLGGIQVRLELGPYNPHVHTLHFFRYLPERYILFYILNNIYILEASELRNDRGSLPGSFTVMDNAIITHNNISLKT